MAAAVGGIAGGAIVSTGAEEDGDAGCDARGGAYAAEPGGAVLALGVKKDSTLFENCQVPMLGIALILFVEM